MEPEFHPLHPPSVFTKFCHLVIFFVATVCALLMFQITAHQAELKVIENATKQGSQVVNLTQGFIRAYSNFEQQYAPGILPNPALFRTQALQLAQLDKLYGGALHSEVIGLYGRAIKRGPKDQDMFAKMQQIEEQHQEGLITSRLEYSDRSLHRTYWPFYAIDKTCIDCHNRIQQLPPEQQWQMGDLMGAQVVEKDITQDLQNVTHNAFLISSLTFTTLVGLSYSLVFLCRRALLAKSFHQMAITDPLTGCINRREMAARVAQLPPQNSGVIMMIDIDHFKQINDVHGHTTGDKVIQNLSQHIHTILTKQAWVARVGGEEFLVWYPDINQFSAYILAEQLREKIKRKDPPINYTVSIGIQHCKHVNAQGFEHWMHLADQKLYQAKRQGRNQVIY
ncbi:MULTISPECIES: GGDEF domain-containing protein [unclassified Vibrio]|uniref:diguanylate cyclase n=1 Tax=Vibrio sp. HB236076 TaxID=3232307 RepID=A0AB39HD99_9VIBR|nr:diguanylate cyclase [Vibrio sp. HB161653]MDP5253772.1 diguanylate cyclase [Vibrio sp. HB161653]